MSQRARYQLTNASTGGSRENVVVPESMRVDIYADGWAGGLQGYVIGDGVKTLATLVSEGLIKDVTVSQADKVDNLPANTNNELASIKAGGLDDDSIALEKLDSATQSAIASGGGSGYTSDITSDLTISPANKATYQNKIIKLTNTTDITITVAAGLGADMAFSFHKLSGAGQVYWDFSSVTVQDNVNFSPLINGEAIGGFVAVAADSFQYLPGSDVQGNSAPVASPSMTGTFEEGQTVTINPNVTDADGDTLGVHEYEHLLYNDSGGSPDLATEQVIATTQAWAIPTGGANVGKHHRASVVPKATTGVLTGTKAFTAYNIIAAEPASNLWLPTDSANTVFWLSSLEETFNDTGGTTAAAVDDPVNGIVKSWRDQEGSVLGSEATDAPTLVSHAGTTAVKFTAQQVLNFGNILDSVVNKQAQGEWGVVALYNLVQTGLAVNALISKKSASDEGMLIRVNGNRRKIQLADGEANDLFRQTESPDNIIGNYITRFQLHPGAALVEDRIRVFDAGHDVGTNPGGSLNQGSGISGGAASADDFLVGGINDVDFLLMELVIFDAPTTDDLERAESAFIYRHGLEASIENPSTGSFVTGGLVTGHTYESAAPTNP
jgi:hypothetical protein